jgi:hypothetical protein
MAPPNIPLDRLVAAVTRAVGLADSATAFIVNAGELIKDAVRVALEADDAADEGSIAAANEAIDAEITKITSADDRLAEALAAGSPVDPLDPPADPPFDPSVDPSFPSGVGGSAGSATAGPGMGTNPIAGQRSTKHIQSDKIREENRKRDQG